MHICYVHLSDGHWTVSWPTKGVHPRMALQNRHLGERRDPRTVTKTLELASFWKEQIRMLGRGVFFVETGCILASLTPSTQAMVAGLLRELVSNGLSDRLVTSTYV